MTPAMNPTIFRRVSLTALLATLWLMPGPAFSWTEKTHGDIARDALQLSPKYLNVWLNRFEAEVLEGATQPWGEKPKADDLFDRAAQNLDESNIPVLIEQEAKTIRKLIEKPGNLREVSRSFGRIAHWTSLCGNPLSVHNTSESERFYGPLFDSYVERQSKHFTLVVRPTETRLFRNLTIRQYFKDRQARFLPLYGSLEKEFMLDGRVADPASFGHQSVPFAVASLSYSASVQSVVEVWTCLWSWLGGNSQPQIFSQAE